MQEIGPDRPNDLGLLFCPGCGILIAKLLTKEDK